MRIAFSATSGPSDSSKIQTLARTDSQDMDSAEIEIEDAEIGYCGNLCLFSIFYFLFSIFYYFLFSSFYFLFSIFHLYFVFCILYFVFCTWKR